MDNAAVDALQREQSLTQQSVLEIDGDRQESPELSTSGDSSEYERSMTNADKKSNDDEEDSDTETGDDGTGMESDAKDTENENETDQSMETTPLPQTHSTKRDARVSAKIAKFIQSPHRNDGSA